MKKLIFLIAIMLVSYCGFAQHSENLYSITIGNGAATADVSVPILGDITLVDISGTATLTADWVIQAATTPSYTMSLWGLYRGNVTPGSNIISFFGMEIPSAMYDDTVLFRTTYTGASWKTVLIPNFGNTGFVSIYDIDPNLYDDVTIGLSSSQLAVKDEGITIAKMAPLAAGKIIVGDATGDPAAVSVSGDITLSDAGVVALAASSVETTNITDEHVTLAKIEDVARGSIIVGGASDRPTEVSALTSGQILVGDGTDLNSVAVTGDIDITSAGVTDIQADAITGTEIQDGAIVIEKLETLTAGQVIVADASGIPTAVTMSGDVTVSSAGVASIAAGAVTATELDADINTSLITKSTSESTGHEDGVIAFHSVASTQFKALLTGSQATVFTLENGGMILDVRVVVNTATGVACTMDIGINSATYPAYVDDDGIAAAIDLNATGLYEASDPTYAGVLMDEGFWTNDSGAELYISVTPTVDASATALVGTILITYVPNN